MVVKLKKDEFTGFDIEVEVPKGVFKLDCFDPVTKESYIKYYYKLFNFKNEFEIKEAKIEYEN